MAYNFLRGDRDQPFLLPPDLRDWLPEGHLAWFILDVVDQLDLQPFYRAHRNDGHGHPAYDPKLLLGVLLYAYWIGVHSSRQIERRLNEDIAWEHTFEHQPLGAGLCWDECHSEAVSQVTVHMNESWFAGTGRIIWLASIVKKQVRGMLQLVEFPLQDGGSVLIQVQDAAVGPVTRGLANHSVAERSQRTFEEAISRVQPAAQALLSRLRGLTDTPEEIGVEFGLELSAEAGAFIAAASTTANFKVTLTWRHLHPAAERSG